MTLLSFESTNDVWGRCTNPHNSKYSPGGSTGGEGALLAFGGGRIGIGSDVAGSVRAPAHFSGIYSLRCSTGRWPKMGMNTSMPGQEGIPSVFSPMARTLPDLVYFSQSMISMKPWEYDHSVGWLFAAIVPQSVALPESCDMSRQHLLCRFTSNFQFLSTKRNADSEIIQVHPIAWRSVVAQETKEKTKFKIGVMRSDGRVK